MDPSRIVSGRDSVLRPQHDDDWLHRYHHVSPALLIQRGDLLYHVRDLPPRYGGAYKDRRVDHDNGNLGRAPFPIIQDIVTKSHGIRYTFCVNVALFSLGAIFPLYLNLVPAARKQVDSVKNEDLNHSPREPCQGSVT